MSTRQVENRWDIFTELNWLDPEHTGKVVRQLRELAEPQVDDQELGLLYELARGLHNKRDMQGYVVELGSWTGGSACALAMGVRDSGTEFKPMVTVDCYGYPDPDLPEGKQHVPSTENYIEARETYWRLNLAWEYVCQMITRTDDVFFRLWAKPIRVIFIDSSHVYDLTRQEIAGALPHMVEDSWMVFHDYMGKWSKGVILAVNEWLDENKVWDLDVYRGGTSMVLVHLKRRKSI